jgi:hypothetical protein
MNGSRFDGDLFIHIQWRSSTTAIPPIDQMIEQMIEQHHDTRGARGRGRRRLRTPVTDGRPAATAGGAPG